MDRNKRKREYINAYYKFKNCKMNFKIRDQDDMKLHVYDPDVYVTNINKCLSINEVLI